MRKGLVYAIAVFLLVACGSNRKANDEVAPLEPAPDPVTYVDRVEMDSLVIYRPHFDRIDLVTEVMPSKTDTSVILCFEAAFTGQLLDEFKHSNIAGHHVSGGVFYNGYNCGPNTGLFTWDKETGWEFHKTRHQGSAAILKSVAEKGGMGFGQCLLYYNGERGSAPFKSSSVNSYRALSEFNGELCLIDCARPLPFGSFMDALKKAGVTNAIYCDMGTGWNYSWYRGSDKSVTEMFTVPGKYTTNWVAFYVD